MSFPLLELAQNYFLGSTVRQTSTALSESEPGVRAGLQSMAPLVLGGLLVHAQQPAGAAELATLAQQVYRRGLPGDLSELLAVLQRSSATERALADRGAAMVQAVFGSDYPAVAASIGQQAGLRPESVHALLRVVGVVMLGLLGRHAAQQSLGTAGPASYLASQRESVRHAVGSLPSAVGSTLADLLSGSTRTTAKTVARASDPPDYPAALAPPRAALPAEASVVGAGPVPPAATRAATAGGRAGSDQGAVGPRQQKMPSGTPANDSRPATGVARPGSQPTSQPTAVPERPVVRPARAAARPVRPWPGLLALLGVALLGYIGGKYFKQRSLPQPTTVGAGSPVGEARWGSAPATAGHYEAASDRYYYDLGPSVRLQLPTGRILQVGVNSTEARLFYLLTGNARALPDKERAGICLDQVSFDAGAARLTAASQAQVANLAALLQAYPTAQLKVGGFTDNQGPAEADLLLSADRANAVRNALLRQGIAPSRVAAQGYGQAHPLASNATREGRAQNRRLATLLLKK